MRARGVVAAVLARVLDGASLSEALQGQKQALPEFYWRIIHAGETSGTLGQALDELATFLERSAEFRAKVGFRPGLSGDAADRRRRGAGDHSHDPRSDHRAHVQGCGARSSRRHPGA